MLATVQTLARFERRLHHELPPDRHLRFLRAWLVGNAQGHIRRAVVRRTRQLTPPRNLNLTMTERCNLHCRGCYAGSYARGPEMSAEAMERLVVQARDLGASFVGILGGEPFLRRDMLPVLARHPEVGFRITTNGTMLDDEVVAFLADNPHVLVFISLEGWREQTDGWRGEGVYDQIVEAMLRLRQASVLFGFSVLLHRDNLAVVSSRAFLQTMAERGAHFGAFFPYGPVGSHPDYELVVPEPVLRQVLPLIEERCAALGLLTKIEGYKSPSGSPMAFLDGPGCQAGVGVHVLPDGQVEPCNGIQFAGANALRQPLVEVLQSPLYRRIHEAVQQEQGRCIAIYQPDRIAQAVDATGATGTNRRARPSLDAWVHACSGSCPGHEHCDRGRR